MTAWIVSSCALVLVLLLLRRLLRGKISPRLQYALWALVLVRLLLPVSLGSSAVSVASLLQQSAPEEALSSTVVGYLGGDLPDLAPPVPDSNLPEAEQEAQYEENLAQWQAELDAARAENGTPVTVEHILMAVWGCGALLLALCFLWANLRLGRALRRTRQLLPQRAGRLPVYLTPAVDTPCLFGLVRPAVYLTPAAAQDPVTARHAVEHEYTHYRHADHLWAALRCVCLCLHWYNPLVWWAALASRNDGELACDEATVRRLGEEERAAYGRTLIALTCVKRPALLTTATTMTGSGKTLQARIAAIVKRPRTAAITFAVVLLIAAAAAGCTFAGPRTDGPEEDPQSADPTVEVTPTPAPPAVTALGIEESCWSFQLAYGGKSREFSGRHVGFPYSPQCGLVDLNGDGLDEIAVVLTAAHGSGVLLEELHLFDAATLEEYDTSNLTDRFLDTLTMSGDAENYYIAAPDGAQFSLSKQAVREQWLPPAGGELNHVLGADLTIRYRIGDRGLSLEAGCYANPTPIYVGEITAQVTLNGDQVELTEYDFTALSPTQSEQEPEPVEVDDLSHITFSPGLDAQGAAEEFVREGYPNLFLSLPTTHPRAILRYELMDWSIREVSEDGNAVVGTFHYAFEPADWNSPEIWAGSTHMGSGEYAELAANQFEFLLCRGEDGAWTCVSVATGGVQLP